MEIPNGLKSFSRKSGKKNQKVVFIGGDVLPSGLYAFTSKNAEPEDFVRDMLEAGLISLRDDLGENYPEIFLIMGNDDARVYEPLFQELDKKKLVHYIHERKFGFRDYTVYGYACVPPTPFSLKDWERYDVSRYVDPGCVPPEEGAFTVEVDKKALPFENIKKDLDRLTADDDLSNSIFLFHTPPYKTKLDRAGLDGKFFDHVPLDVHVGSIAVQRFIEDRQPLLTLHGHIHESTSITGSWKDRLGKTMAFNAAHDGPELSLIRFDLEDLGGANRELL